MSAEVEHETIAPYGLITECDAQEPLADYAGHCPACHESVWYSEEGEHGPIWTCPTDLHPLNPHHEEVEFPVRGATKAVNECESNCWMLHGMKCDVLDMPLHAACYEGDLPW